MPEARTLGSHRSSVLGASSCREHLDCFLALGSRAWGSGEETRMQRVGVGKGNVLGFGAKEHVSKRKLQAILEAPIVHG